MRVHATVEDLARAKQLAPEIVEAILDGRQPPEIHGRSASLAGFPLELSDSGALDR